MTQASPPALVDRAALVRNRCRARHADADLFLHAEAAIEIQERLAMVNRDFTAPAIVTGMPQAWSALRPDAKLVQDSDTLDLGVGEHDLVIHALSLQWAEDPVGQLIQARRALRSDGLFLGVTLGGQTLSELRQALAEAEVGLTGGLSPRVLPMAEIRDLGALLQRAGFVLPVADSMTRKVSYSDALHLMRDLRAMGEGNALAGRRRAFTPRGIMLRAAEIYAAHFSEDTGRVAATFDLICLTGWSPGPGQPRPLRPGSATARLADALNTRETPLQDEGRAGAAAGKI